MSKGTKHVRSNLMNLALDLYDKYVFFHVNEDSNIIPKNLVELLKLIL